MTESNNFSFETSIDEKENQNKEEVKEETTIKEETNFEAKENSEHEEVNKELEDFTNSAQSLFDQFISSKVETLEVDKVEMIPTGLRILDAILGGGIPLGRFVLLAGYPGGGKSTLAAKILANLQEKYKKDSLMTYLDSEQTMSRFRLSQLGVNKPSITPKSGITVEKVFELIEGICMFKDENKITDIPTVVVWDSIANTPTEKDLVAKDVNETIGLKARILSIGLPNIITKLNEYNITLLAVNQLRDKLNIGMFSSPSDLRYMTDKDMPGGQSIKFNAAQLLLLSHKQDLKKEQHGFDGAKVVCKTIKNKFFTPNIEIELALDFVNGFSDFWTSYLFLVDKKYIKTGAWNKLEGYDKNFRTKEALNYYNDDPKFKETFDNLVEEAINTHIISTYLNEK